MILGKIRKTMKGAIVNLSNKEGVKRTSVSLFINPIDDECTPRYIYAIDGKLKRDKDGNVLSLNFNKDILNVKFDLLGQESIAAMFLKGYIKNAAEAENIDPNSLFIRIDSDDEAVSNLIIGLYNRAEHVKPLTLEDIFSD